ncbi:MAG: hypothetical protein MK116_04220 [Phycisphaerales bacterium]|nr:hypothetical protein [Phycisphaerales bacterium]
MKTEPKRVLRATCAPGLAPWLKAEVEEMGYDIDSTDHTGVEIRGQLVDAMRLLLRLRTAFHVLQRFADLYPKNADDLYEGASGLPWERVIPADGYLTVVSTVRNDTIRNSMFANVRLKDAIVDRLQRVHGRRPDSGPRGDRTVVHMFWKDDQCRLALDLSGRKLSDRGYRRMPGRAPMRESIAAAVLAETGYDSNKPLVIPMCGSGTLAIEAALLATGRAPGLLRPNFGIKHLLTFDETTWGQERLAAKKLRHDRAPAPIIASDIDPAATDAARKNAVTAGVDHLIEFHECDFADTPLPETPGTIILHGEYGERLGDLEQLKQTYGRIGDFLKQRCGGWNGWVFTSRELVGSIGLKSTRKVPFENVEIDCRLAGFELYAGSRST